MTKKTKEQQARKNLWNLIKAKYKGRQRKAAISRVKTLLKEYDGSYRSVYDFVIESLYSQEEEEEREGERERAAKSESPYLSYLDMREL